MPALRLTIPVTASAPPRLDELLRETLPSLLTEEGAAFSNSKIRRLIVSGAVSVNGRRETRPAAPVRTGGTVTVLYDGERFAREKKPDDVPCEITGRDVLYEDDLIIAVNKPAGIPTEGTVVDSRDSLHAAVRRYLARSAGGESPYAGLHHRLDRETSGIVLFTKRPSANAAVHAMFENHTARKTYLALSGLQPVNPARRSGSLTLRKEGDTATVENFVGRITAKSARAQWGAVPEEKGGVPAKTVFTVCRAFRTALLVRCEPYTGRTHQIRVHLSGLGAPILGDPLYGGPESLASGKPVPRVMLHAAELAFPHPADDREMLIRAPEPADFQECLAALEP